MAPGVTFQVCANRQVPGPLHPWQELVNNLADFLPGNVSKCHKRRLVGQDNNDDRLARICCWRGVLVPINIDGVPYSVGGESGTDLLA